MIAGTIGPAGMVIGIQPFLKFRTPVLGMQSLGRRFLFTHASRFKTTKYTMSTAVPQVRPLTDATSDCPTAKKMKLAGTDSTETARNKEDAMGVQEGDWKRDISNTNAKRKKKKKKDPPLPEPCSPADVLYREIRKLLGESVVDGITKSGKAFSAPYPHGEKVEVKIEMLGSGGCGIALAPKEKGPWAIVVPWALPGETVRVQIGRWDRMHSSAQLLEVIHPNVAMRDDSRIRCKYFGTCGGCQYQMLSSEKQLELKKDVIIRAYGTYSGLPESSIPLIEETVESPLVYGYRTKITPHFERPPKRIKPYDTESEYPDWLKIGFNVASSNSTMDIEECPIATPILNEKYKYDRIEISKKIFSYKKGVSLLYRDSLDPSFDPNKMMTAPVDKLSEAFTKHVCVSNHNAISREMVGDYLFQYTAGGFFQNNNAILPLMVDYVRDLIDPSSGKDHSTHLVDAYCGAGLFAISLSARFNRVAGIELSQSSIASAKQNAELNGISENKISFMSGDASDIFATVREFPAEKTVVVIDPPRKGCDETFIGQLVKFRPAIVVYVSCNVHTQARDVGDIVRRTEGDGEGQRYRLERLRGFDLFPQTAHVESVALLRLY